MINEDAIREDFLAWSGGFPPESEEQIADYCEAARPADTDFNAAYAFLREWANKAFVEEAAAILVCEEHVGEFDLNVILTSQTDEDISEDWCMSVEVPESVNLSLHQIVTIAAEGAKQALLAAGLRFNHSRCHHHQVS